MSTRASHSPCALPPQAPHAQPLCPTWVRQDLAHWAPALARATADLRMPQAPTSSTAAPPYARAVLHHSTAGELMLARWQRDAQCAIHDHGGGHGRVYVLSGGVHEQRWVDEAAVRNGQLPAVRVLRAGESLQVDSATFHAMRSDADLETLTLHAYVGVAHPVRIALPRQRSTLAVPSDHGAWLPLPETILEEEAWPND